jgi:hypothetical protein
VALRGFDWPASVRSGRPRFNSDRSIARAPNHSITKSCFRLNPSTRATLSPTTSCLDALLVRLTFGAVDLWRGWAARASKRPSRAPTVQPHHIRSWALSLQNYSIIKDLNDLGVQANPRLPGSPSENLLCLSSTELVQSKHLDILTLRRERVVNHDRGPACPEPFPSPGEGFGLDRESLLDSEAVLQLRPAKHVLYRAHFLAQLDLCYIARLGGEE